MKKILIGFIALTSTSAFADDLLTEFAAKHSLKCNGLGAVMGRNKGVRYDFCSATGLPNEVGYLTRWVSTRSDREKLTSRFCQNGASDSTTKFGMWMFDCIH